MMNKALQHKNYKDDWETPDDIFNEIDNVVYSVFKRRINLDVAATLKNLPEIYGIKWVQP